MILHCIYKEKWEAIRQEKEFGQKDLDAFGFVHCSSVQYFWRVAPNFKDVQEELVLLCIDPEKLESPVKYEDGDQCGRAYPHVYGLINTSSVIDVLPFNKKPDGEWIKNKEFLSIENE